MFPVAVVGGVFTRSDRLRAAAPCSPSDGYYEEDRGVTIIPIGCRAQSGVLMGVGPGLR